MADPEMNLPFLQPQLQVLSRMDQAPRHRLRLLVDSMWEEVTVLELELKIIHCEIEAYACGEGLVLIKTEDWPQGRELLLYGAAGRGIMKLADGLCHDLEELARYKNCSMIGTHVNSPGWDKLFKRLGGRPVSTHYVKEI